MERFQTVLNLGVKHQTVLGYGALSLLAAGGEQVFSLVVFRCPCNSWSFSYSLVFMLVPALVLLLLGFLLSSRSWRLLTGCCILRGSRGGSCSKRLQVIWLLAVRSSVAPITWIAVALLHATYYECLATGKQAMGSSWQRDRLCQGMHEACQKELHRLPCANTLSLALPMEQVEEVLLYLRAESQVLGWILIASVMTFALLCTCINHCRSPVSFLQLAFWKIYLEKEKELFECKAKEHAGQLAERNVKSFFECSSPEPFKTPSNKEWQQISSLYSFNAKGQHYSMIHKFVERPQQNGSIRSAEGDVFAPVLHFVDGAEFGDSGI